MNQSSIENSIQRYNRKRNSYDAMKTSLSLKNPKKPLPEVCIDLNQHHKKHRLALQQRIVKGNQPIEISHFNDPKKTVKAGKKKDQLTLNSMYNTQLMRGQDENKNILNEYRDEIELLKLQNEKLKEQNNSLKRNQEYYCRRIKELKQEKNQQEKELKDYVQVLQKKLTVYSQKIKALYEELITQKKKGKHSNTIMSEKADNFAKGELYSYRMQQNNRKTQYGKRLTSPSPSSNDRQQWKDELDTIFVLEKRGEEAFYRMNEGAHGFFRSRLDQI